MTGMWHLDEIITDFRSAKHHRFTKMIIHGGVQSFMTQFDDGGHEIHHIHDLVPLVRPPEGGVNGVNAVTSRHGGRFE